MAEDGIPLLERVANYYSQLSSVAADLNAVSDELGKSISDIDGALKKLNLGIAAWVPIQSGEEDYSFWSRDVGYAKVGGKWGISLRKVDGDYTDPDRAAVEEWPFNEAPRALRLEAIDKIPALLETLSNDAVKTTKDIRAKLGEAQAVAEAVKRAANLTVRTPLRTAADASRPKIDLTQVSKPGDVLKAILANKQSEQASAERTPKSAATTNLGVDSLRSSIGAALVDAGHTSAAGMLGCGNWSLDGQSIRIEVPGMGKKMLALTVNAAAEKVIRQELQRLGAPTRFLVVPGEVVMQGARPTPVPGKAAAASKEEEW
jgi:hypothetical protein